MLLSKDNKKILVVAAALISLSALSACSTAGDAPPPVRIDLMGDVKSKVEPSPPPPDMASLQEQNIATDLPKKDDSPAGGMQIRKDALREAALSYGARGGLAARTFEIQRRLAEYDTNFMKIYDFRRLLIAAPSGLLIEPPVVSEAQQAVLVNGGGQEAAIADRIYKINRAARIVTAARDWHLYMERDWGRVDPPPGLLLPKDEEERNLWRKWVAEGWEEGIKQAQETFESDLTRMTNDFVGMVRYRELLAQGMISPPYALNEERGITGGGSEMRIGDRGVMITGPSALIPRSDKWTTAPR
ncbi:MAG: type IV secretory system conjugative DNA transfer family protein [Alphaproteobacteria bacterium]|nr:type IV secretory system conjugative DNA transfer family protein [Alphaproteobacteria bacterium]